MHASKNCGEKLPAPLVSYLVLSYNHVDFVEQAIVSILVQDYPRIELVVVDDGSTDGSAELLRTLRDRHGFLLIEQPNAGVVAAFNRGVMATTGEFVVPHASDDLSTRQRTRQQLESFQGDPSVGFVVGGIRKISALGAELEPWIAGGRARYDFDDFIRGRGRAIAVSCMHRADVLRRVVPLDASLSFEDVQLYWRITHLGFSCVNDFSVYAVDYRIVPNALGRSKRVEHHHSFRRLVEEFADHPAYPDALRRANAGMFAALAETARRDALVFFAREHHRMALGGVVRGFVKLILPRVAVRYLKRSF